jgi:polyisoprenoid-binding protein YceI
VLAVGVPYVYFHFIEGKTPAKLALPAVTTTTRAPGGGTTAPSTPARTAPAALSGRWKVGKGSTVGYRVKEMLIGQSHTAVGRTSSVTGTATISGTTVTAASFGVDMTTFTSNGSDHGIRDDQFQHRIMDTADFPTATFVLTDPIDLAPVPAEGTVKSYPATGKLTMHGTTRTVTIPLNTRRTGNVIAVQGILPVTFSDFNINNPSGGPASVGDSGQLELLLQLQPS